MSSYNITPTAQIWSALLVLGIGVAAGCDRRSAPPAAGSHAASSGPVVDAPPASASERAAEAPPADVVIAYASGTSVCTTKPSAAGLAAGSCTALPSPAVELEWRYRDEIAVLMESNAVALVRENR